MYIWVSEVSRVRLIAVNSSVNIIQAESLISQSLLIIKLLLIFISKYKPFLNLITLIIPLLLIDFNDLLVIVAIVTIIPNIYPHFRKQGLLIKLHINFSRFRKQRYLQLILLPLSVSLLMIIYYPHYGLFAHGTLLLQTKQLYPYSVAQRVKILVQKQLLHLLIYHRQLIPQYYLHYQLILPPRNVHFRVLNHMNQYHPKRHVYLLRMNRYSVNKRRQVNLILILIVPSQQGHLRHYPKQHPHQTHIIKQLLQIPTHRHYHLPLRRLVQLTRRPYLLQKHIIRSDKLIIYPPIPSLYYRYLTHQLVKLIAVQQQQRHYRQTFQHLKNVCRFCRQLLLQISHLALRLQRFYQRIRRYLGIYRLIRVQVTVYLAFKYLCKKIHLTLSNPTLISYIRNQCITLLNICFSSFPIGKQNNKKYQLPFDKDGQQQTPICLNVSTKKNQTSSKLNNQKQINNRQPSQTNFQQKLIPKTINQFSTNKNPKLSISQFDINKKLFFQFPTPTLIITQHQTLQSTKLTIIRQKMSHQESIHMNQNNQTWQQAQTDSVFIRHAQSNFNKGGLTYVYQNNLHHKGWLELIQDHHFNQAITYNPDYIDPHITEEGIQQCHQTRQQLNPHHYDLILVSPQLRALQTCSEIFGHENPNVIVHPLVTEVVRYSCDVSHSIQQKIDLFPHYNFEQMKNWTHQWYLEVLSEQKRNICQSYFNQHKIDDFQNRQLAVLQLLSKHVISETAQQLRHRVARLKQLINKLKTVKKAKKVAVISHHYTTQCLLSPGFDQHGNVIGIGEILNGKPYFRKLDDVLKVQ